MFYTRPNLPQLGIDLVEAHGGGSCPSQFYGRMANGRQIYMRYRNGCLGIWEGHDDDLFEKELLSADFGPPFDGDILLEQVCDLAGITIRGEKPFLTEAQLREAAKQGPVTDWSGRTTYWIRDVLISPEGAQRLSDALTAAFPAMMILESLWRERPPRRVFVRRKSVRECARAAVFCFDAHEPARTCSAWLGLDPKARWLKQLQSGKQAPITDLDLLFAHHLALRIRWNDVKLSGNTPESSDIELPGYELIGSLDTKFATNDPAGQEFARKLIATIDQCFSTWAEKVDLATGAVVGEPWETRWYTHDLREWCEAASNRFFWIHPAAESAGDVGIRPRRAPT